MNERFRPQQRIRKPRQFQIIFQKGKPARGALFNLWSYQTKESEEKKTARLGLVVSRKTSPLATERNLWKRRIREAFRRNQSRLRADMMILIQSKKQNKVPSYQAIEEEMLKLLAKTGSLK